MGNMKLLTTREVGDRCGVNGRTVARWLRDGDLQGIKLNKHTWRVREEELERFIQSKIVSPE